LSVVKVLRETDRSKLLLWSVMFLMTLSVLFYSEIAFLSPSNPARPHHHSIRWWLIPHLLCGITAICCGPLQFSTRLRRHNPLFHRTVGKVYVLAVLIGASFAFYMDLTVENHSTWQIAAGPVLHSTTWFFTALIAYRTAITRSFQVHRQWMIRSYLITFTFVLVRLPNPIPAWRNMSDPSFSLVLVLLMFFCYFIADVVLNLREITKKRTGTQAAPEAAARAIAV
jgi:hypothetical protein